MSKKYIYTVAFCVGALVLLALTVTLCVGNNADVKKPPVENTLKLADDAYCLLVTGTDRVSALTDVIMLVSFDPKEQRICVLQIPRDTYAKYNDGGYRKINGAQKALGTDGLCRFFEQALGVDIDGYISLDLAAFRKTVDLLGGVEIELERPLNYSDSSQGLKIELESGRQVLNGEQAEMLVRYRSGYLRGDLDRLDVQKKFLSALFDTLKSKVSAANAYGLLTQISDEVDTNINIALGAALGLEALTLDKSRLLFCTLPGEDAISAKSGGSFYIFSKSGVRDLLSQYFDAEIAERADEVFMSRENEEFCKIYKNHIDARVFSADEYE